MPRKDIVVVGASAGGVDACKQLVSEVPADFEGSIFIVIHIPGNGVSVIPEILSRYGPLPAVHPEDGTAVKPGRIYVAPPNYHMLLKRGYIRLIAGPEENHSRPAIDPLFRSASAAYGSRVVGVVLTGSLDDGTAGLKMIKMRGGTTVVQDPGEARFPSMPKSAVNGVSTDYILPLNRIGDVIGSLARAEAPDHANPGENEQEPDILEMPLDDLHSLLKGGKLTGFTCPRCGGILREKVDGDSADFRCRVGHAFSIGYIESLLTGALESALWNAVRVLEEKEQLSMRLAKRMAQLKNRTSEDYFRQLGKKATEDANIIREIILERQIKSEAEVARNSN